MIVNAVSLEEERLKEINNIEDYNMVHERHRIFPQVFEKRDHKKIIDLSAGVGVVGKRVLDNYPGEIICNDISPKCLSILKKNGLKTISFNLDNGKPFPFENKSFDAVISLATIEHILNIDFFISEINRILKDDGYLYISTPNYAGLLYIVPVLITGKTFHNPLHPKSRYEFYAHIRYFTYKTMLDYISSFGFCIEKVYSPVPKESTRYLELKSKSRIKALIFKLIMSFFIKFLSPRWASEPVLCFKKSNNNKNKIKAKKVVL